MIPWRCRSLQESGCYSNIGTGTHKLFIQHADGQEHAASAVHGDVNRHTNCAKDPWLCSAKSALRHALGWWSNLIALGTGLSMYAPLSHELNMRP